MELNNQFLFQEIETAKKLGVYKELPTYIEKNLSSKLTIRSYQESAFRNFITYFENPNFKRNQTQVLFHMATGSGKTLIMAGLILYLFNQGYRNFLFFVGYKNIIEKTKENFMNTSSIKYLFNSSINILGEDIKIKEVQNFQNVDNNNINICFTSIQRLHENLNHICENKVTLEDFADKKVVLIADEAHHLNASTKNSEKKQSKKDKDEGTWENTVDKIFKSNKENVLLEFTATCELQNPNIKKLYMDKIIMNYPLIEYRNDKYSKEVETISVDLELDDRVLQAVLLSQYRLKLFQKNKISIKPVLLLKHKIVKESREYQKHFHEIIKNLSVERLQNIKSLSTAPVIKEMFEFFEKHSSLENIVEEIKENFSEDKCICANNDNELSDVQIKINTLEDRNNLFRCVFAVDKLNEGWDVLNLFDIVRLYDSISKKSDGTPEKQTVQEAQLIGRGARYCPFVINEFDDKYKRKFDNDLDNELRICEAKRADRIADMNTKQTILSKMSNSNNCILFDEAEDLFNTKRESKAFVNNLLESNTVPVFWTTNNTYSVDPAVLRRMTFAVRFEKQSNEIRLKIWKNILKKHKMCVDENKLIELNNTYDIAPALITNAVKSTKLINGTQNDFEYFIDNIAQLVDKKKSVKKCSSTDAIEYNEDLVNADINVKKLVQKLKDLNKMNFSMCLYGEPGTGKSEYAKHIAKELGIKVVSKRASDILSMWVGGSEKNIADSFEEARQEKAMLIIDEVDSFLQSRAGANRSWEISIVNEMLTQMESFEYPLVCTTNLMDTLDEATLRRFTFKIKFDFLKPEQVKIAFKDFFNINISDDESTIKGLTTGDFVTVKKKAEFMDVSDKNTLIKMLCEEVKVKKSKSLKQAIGF